MVSTEARALTAQVAMTKSCTKACKGPSVRLGAFFKGGFLGPSLGSSGPAQLGKGLKYTQPLPRPVIVLGITDMTH